MPCSDLQLSAAKALFFPPLLFLPMRRKLLWWLLLWWQCAWMHLIVSPSLCRALAATFTATHLLHFHQKFSFSLTKVFICSKNSVNNCKWLPPNLFCRVAALGTVNFFSSFFCSSIYIILFFGWWITFSISASSSLIQKKKENVQAGKDAWSGLKKIMWEYWFSFFII